MVTPSQALAMPVAQVIIGYPWQVMLLSLSKAIGKARRSHLQRQKEAVRLWHRTATQPNFHVASFS
jgi:hypothetical protein